MTHCATSQHSRRPPLHIQDCDKGLNYCAACLALLTRTSKVAPVDRMPLRDADWLQRDATLEGGWWGQPYPIHAPHDALRALLVFGLAMPKPKQTLRPTARCIARIARMDAQSRAARPMPAPMPPPACAGRRLAKPVGILSPPATVRSTPRHPARRPARPATVPSRSTESACTSSSARLPTTLRSPTRRPCGE